MDRAEPIQGWQIQTIEQSFQEAGHLKNFVSFINRAQYQSLKLKNKKLQLNLELTQRRNKQPKYNFLNANLFKANPKGIHQKQSSILESERSLSKGREVKNEQYKSCKSEVKISYFNSGAVLGQKLRSNWKYLDQRQQCGFLPKRKKKSCSVKDIRKQDRITGTKIKREADTSKNKDIVDWKSYQTLNQEKMKRLKSLFFKTVENKSYDEQKTEKKYQIRLKNALDSSNKKRKQLQNIFRRREYFQQTNLSKILNFQSIYHVTSGPPHSFFEANSLQQSKSKGNSLGTPRKKQKMSKLTKRNLIKKQL